MPPAPRMGFRARTWAALLATLPALVACGARVKITDTSAGVGTSPPPPAYAAAPVPNSAAPAVAAGAGRASVNTVSIRGLAANGIPNVALNAYQVAAARVDNVAAWCGIDWALLAGIGRVESDHGRFGGAVLNDDGTSTPRIIGPALDGKHWDYVPAPANGRQLDGDAKYAHALGPMQFIPSTWAIYGADGNGDGYADAFNINDAALGAARYLCSAGGDLRTQQGVTRAVLAYNHSRAYLAEVVALADAYRKGLRVTSVPVGDTQGSLAPVRRSGSAPPVNPGAPTALGHKTGSTPARSTSPKPTRPTSGAPSPSQSATCDALHRMMRSC